LAFSANGKKLYTLLEGLLVTMQIRADSRFILAGKLPKFAPGLLVEDTRLPPDDLTKKTFVSGCPVPFEQQPLNEYKELSNSWFFHWATLELSEYIKKLIWIWIWSWAIAGPVAAASFLPAKHLVQFLLMGAAGSSLFLSLVLLRLYLGWSYIRSRLSNSTVFYEESGWYDGQTWSKPLEIQTQDRLVVTYQVQPVLNRLKQTLGTLALLLLGGGLVWALV
jgi:hypothetical protein